jgi:hypothetical protein
MMLSKGRLVLFIVPGLADWLPEMPYPLAATAMVAMSLVLLGLAVHATIRILRYRQD